MAGEAQQSLELRRTFVHVRSLLNHTALLGVHMVGKDRSRAAKQQLPSAADGLPPAKSTVGRTSADRLKLAAGVRGAPHINSVDKAAKAFANFSIDRYAADAVPANYIDRRKVDVKDRAA